ncbi:MAG: TerC family protein [Phycisphaerae bacterium]|nr:TerC family protein [Phycisphaerae bacterium]
MPELASILSAENAVALVTLTAMEIVLGIDNLVFITILCGRLPERDRPRVRTIGLTLAVVMRIVLLLSVSWIMGLTAALTTYRVPFLDPPDAARELTGKSIILLLGGLFLLFKAVKEIHHKMEAGPGDPLSPAPGAPTRTAAAAGVGSMIVQIILLDLVFSIDSVITAVGMVKSIPVMITAVIISISVMIAFAGSLGRFVDRHPAIKMLALSFLVLIGVMLFAEGLGQHVPKGYIYFAMAFALGVEVLNIRAGSRAGKA